MPELPEVEITKAKIEPYLLNYSIEKIVVRVPKLRWDLSKKLAQIQHQPVIGISRRAKYIIIQLEQGYLVIHLGMTGFFKVVSQSIGPEKHDHIDMVLDNGIVLRYNDVRRFGSWQWIDALENCVSLQALGVEPFAPEFNSDYLLKKFTNKSIPCKQAIMDHQIVVGVGNIYASEALFLAKINPFTPAKTLTLLQLTDLVIAIQKVLDKAIKKGGTTIRDFQQPDGKIGYFAHDLNVYGRAGQPCKICQTTIENKVIAQRNTFYCVNCQK